MSAEKLLRAIGTISDDLILETENQPLQLRVVSHNWKKWSCIAACAALVVAVGAWGITSGLFSPRPLEPGLSSMNGGMSSSSSSSSIGGGSGLPLLTIQPDDGAFGFEGYMAYDITDLINQNPWNEQNLINPGNDNQNLTTLPVFSNPNAYRNGRKADPDFDKMKEQLLEVGKRLSMAVDTLEITDDRPDAETIKKLEEKYAQVGEKVPPEALQIGRLFLEDDQYKLEVDAALTVTIRYKEPVSLPEGYQFNYQADYEDVVKVAEYLKEEYASLIGMKNPVTNISGGDYTIYNERLLNISFYEGEGDLQEQMINYHFNEVTFACDDDGKLFLSRVFAPDLSQKVGDYPIISTERAKELLGEGKFLTTVPEDFPGLEKVAKVELIYRSGREEYFIPYYRFLVEIPSMQREGNMKTYGAYYVPAVEEQYIENMPIWDGSFN